MKGKESDVNRRNESKRVLSVISEPALLPSPRGIVSGHLLVRGTAC